MYTCTCESVHVYNEGCMYGGACICESMYIGEHGHVWMCDQYMCAQGPMCVQMHVCMRVYLCDIMSVCDHERM